MLRRLFNGLGYIFGVYAIGMIVFTLFRLLLFIVFTNANGLDNSTTGQVFTAFWMGVRFDTVVSCYILSVPLLATIVFVLFRIRPKPLFVAVKIWVSLLYAVAFLLSAANIPYFMQFYKPINSSVWNWLGEPSFVLGMIFHESSFVVYALLFVIVLVVYVLAVHLWTGYNERRAARFAADVHHDHGNVDCALTVLVSIMAGLLCGIGIRGRTAAKAPIKIGTAYFCNNAFLNQLGLNPTFVFLKTSMEMRKERDAAISLADPKEALAYCADYFGREVSGNKWGTAVAPADTVEKRNVVLILLESCCVQLLDWKDRTPFLNELASKSVFYPNTFSSGIHTMNGIYSSMYGFPAQLDRHPFRNIRKYAGLPSELRKNGYNTLYFTTHDDQFDNIGGFVLNSDIESVFAECDYPSCEVRSNLGVPDDYMFRYAVSKISELQAADGKPFFAMMLTASNHQPYIIPEYFTPKEGTTKQCIVEYADWALSRFFDEASRRDWYKNTIYVLVGDHGSPEAHNVYDVSLPYHQVPLLFYEPGREDEAVRCTSLAEQTDIWPTVMGRLGLPYTDESFGIDLARRTREMVCFSSDDAYCCVDSVHYYVNRMDGRESLYNYAVDSPVDSLAFYRDKARVMDEFARNIIQAAYLLSSD